MKINSIGSYNDISKQYTEKQMARLQKENKAIESKIKDTVEISKKAHDLYENVKAISGKEKLNVRIGTNGNYIIRLEDSASVSRLVERGYFEVNGKKITLTEEDKKKLIATDKQAEQQRMAEFMKTHLEHNMEAAKQQAATWELYFKGRKKLMDLIIKVSSGDPVSPAELNQLLEADPQAYQMAITLRMMKERNKKQQEKQSVDSTDNEEIKRLEKVASGESKPVIEWKGYEVAMEVNSTELSVGEVSVHEKTISTGV